MCVRPSVCPSVTFCLFPGTNIFHTQGGQISLHMGRTNIFVGGDGDGYDVDGHKEEEDVSEASKLSAGARIFRGPEGPKILVII